LKPFTERTVDTYIDRLLNRKVSLASLPVLA